MTRVGRTMPPNSWTIRCNEGKWSAEPQRETHPPTHPLLSLPSLPADLLPPSGLRSLLGLWPTPPLLPRISHSMNTPGLRLESINPMGLEFPHHTPTPPESQCGQCLTPPLTRPSQGHCDLGASLKQLLPSGHFSSAISPGVQENRKPTPK